MNHIEQKAEEYYQALSAASILLLTESLKAHDYRTAKDAIKKFWADGASSALAEALPLIKRCHEDQMGFPLWDDLKAFLEKYEGETK